MLKKAALSLALAASVALVGCGSEEAAPEKEAAQEQAEQTPTQVVDLYLAAMKKGDMVGAEKYSVEKMTDEQKAVFEQAPPEVTSAMFSQLEADVSNEQINGDKATVDVKLTAVDFMKATQEMMSAAMEAAMSGDTGGKTQEQLQAEMQEKMLASLKDPNSPKVTSDVTLHLEKTADGWKVSANNEALAGAMFGAPAQ